MTSNFKTPRWKSEPYREFVRTLPCSDCQTTEGVVPHHLIGQGGLSAMGLKAPDWVLMPLCTGCHDKLHRAGKDVRQYEWIIKTLSEAIKAGELVL